MSLLKRFILAVSLVAASHAHADFISAEYNSAFDGVNDDPSQPLVNTRAFAYSSHYGEQTFATDITTLDQFTIQLGIQAGASGNTILSSRTFSFSLNGQNLGTNLVIANSSERGPFDLTFDFDTALTSNDGSWTFRMDQVNDSRPGFGSIILAQSNAVSFRTIEEGSPSEEVSEPTHLGAVALSLLSLVGIRRRFKK